MGYKHYLLPVYVFFVRVAEYQYWRAMGGMAPMYEEVSPYARVGALARAEPPGETSEPRLIWADRAQASVANLTIHPAVIGFQYIQVVTKLLVLE